MNSEFYIGLAALLALLAVVGLAMRSAVLQRVRSDREMNRLLRAQVEERTHSIEQARQHLQQSNERLSREMEARAEIEERLQLTFEHAPSGLGLLDADGRLFEANPALRRMFWAEANMPRHCRFADVVCDEHCKPFESQFQSLLTADLDVIDEKVFCNGHDGEVLQTIVSASAVHTETGDFRYAVLQVQDVTESSKLTVQLEYQASYDELTGLLNRRAFEKQLKNAWENGAEAKTQSHLMFMDLDQFKVVNDTSGHTAGDQLLQRVSEILKDNVRNNDVVGRLGGDEFGIILWECPKDVALRIAESIRQSIESFRFCWDAETYRIGISIGALPVDPEIGDINEIQQLADAACYAAKEAGRNRVHMVSGERDSARVHRGQAHWVQRLRDAMDNNRFAIYGQPIRALADGLDEPDGMEILLRLRDHDNRKLIPPGAFLPAAERYGQSVELDKWVVTSLLNTLFVHQAFQAEQRKFWINLSGCSVGDPRFSEFLKEAIARSPLPPGTINFEIAETTVIRSLSEARELMSALRDMGSEFALDDFGSGLSSFVHLKKLPVDYVKIDGMFIRDLLREKVDQIFVKSIIDIAHEMGIKAVAEFVDCNEVFELVRELGADYAQGFAIARPFVLAPRFTTVSKSNSGLAAIKAHAS